MSEPTVVDFPKNAGDICHSLRRMADAIESGEYPNPRFVIAVCVYEEQKFTTYGFGQHSILEAVGALSWAAARGLVDDDE